MSLAGYRAVSVPSDSRGLVSPATLRDHLDGDVAAMMLTNPNTLGLFEEDVADVARAVHDDGALMYYDGANLNAILGVARPGDMGFDIVHLNLHKTFAVPHGGGGPGAGPVAVTATLADFLPGPVPARLADGSFGWAVPAPLDRPGARLARQRARFGTRLDVHHLPTAPTGCGGSPRLQC